MLYNKCRKGVEIKGPESGIGGCMQVAEQITDIGRKRKRKVVEPLYLSYYGDMHRYAMSLLHDEDDAEDAVQAAFLRAVERWLTLSPMKETEKRNFLFMELRNAVLDILRRRKLLKPVSIDALEAQERLTLHMTRSYKEIIEALYGLPKWHRDTLIDVYVLGNSCGEIAERLGMQKNAIEKRIERAKAAIRGWRRTGIYW